MSDVRCPPQGHDGHADDRSLEEGPAKGLDDGHAAARPGPATDRRPGLHERFIPAREDVATPASWSSPRSTRAAIEEMPAGCIAVIDAMGVKEAGAYGDILCARMAKRGVAALVTDAVVRDAKSVIATGLPIWCDGAATPPSVAALHFVGWQEPVGYGGVGVFPDDIIVADDDGATVIPAAIATEVAETAVEQEQLEGWIMREVDRGVPLPGLYPPNDETRARYERARSNI